MAQEEKKSRVSSDTISLLTNRKIILGVTSLIVLIAVIFLFSFVPYTISPGRLKEPSFITDLLMVCVITIFALVGTLFIGQASNAQNKKSNIAKATSKFLITKQQVEDRGQSVFKQWIVAVLQEQDKKVIYKRLLEQSGIEDLSVLKLTIKEIQQLTVPQKFNGEFYKELTKNQIKLLVKIKTGKIKINFVPPEYYLSVKSIVDARTRSERANAEGTQKGKIVFSSVASKLLLTIAFSVVMALFVKDVTSGEYSDIEIASKLFSRLASFFSSVFMGYLVGCQINDIDAEYIEMRSSTHVDFLEDKEFVGKSVKEQAKEAFINRVKDEQVLKLDNKSNQLEMKTETEE